MWQIHFKNAPFLNLCTLCSCNLELCLSAVWTALLGKYRKILFRSRAISFKKLASRRWLRALSIFRQKWALYFFVCFSHGYKLIPDMWKHASIELKWRKQQIFIVLGFFKNTYIYGVIFLREYMCIDKIHKLILISINKELSFFVCRNIFLWIYLSKNSV